MTPAALRIQRHLAKATPARIRRNLHADDSRWRRMMIRKAVEDWHAANPGVSVGLTPMNLVLKFLYGPDGLWKSSGFADLVYAENPFFSRMKES